MKRTYFFLQIFILFIATSCSNEELPVVGMGELSNYPSFLFWSGDTTVLTKRIVLDFNDDAQGYGKETWAEFAFVNDSGTVIDPKYIEIAADGFVLPNNTFRANAEQQEIELRFRYLGEDSKVNQGTLRMLNYNNLERIDNQSLSQGQPTDILKWTVDCKHRWNPLAQILAWLGGILLGASLLWISVLKFIMIPRFRAINKMVIIPNQAPISIRFNGARMVVLDNVRHKQSWWNCLWTGRIVYKYHPALTSRITLKPSVRGRKILFIAPITNYICSPNPIDIQPSNVTDVLNHQQIIIQ